jgi:hypothetical protein
MIVKFIPFLLFPSRMYVPRSSKTVRLIAINMRFSPNAATNPFIRWDPANKSLSLSLVGVMQYDKVEDIRAASQLRLLHLIGCGTQVTRL